MADYVCTVCRRHCVCERLPAGWTARLVHKVGSFPSTSFYCPSCPSCSDTPEQSEPEWSARLDRAIELLDAINGKLDKLVRASEPAQTCAEKSCKMPPHGCPGCGSNEQACAASEKKCCPDCNHTGPRCGFHAYHSPSAPGYYGRKQ